MDNADLWVAQLAKHRNSGVAIDTQLLLLLWVGNFDRSLIGRFKRVKKYSETDFDLLVGLVARCPKLVTTPNVLTELSNWAGQLPEDLVEEFREEFRRAVAKLNERLFESVAVTQLDGFLRLGLADSTLIKLAKQDVLVLTDDHPLYQQLVADNLPAINFTHVRTSAYGWQT